MSTKSIIKAIALSFLLCLPQILSAQNTWTAKADFGGVGRSYAVSFAIGSKIYLGTGGDEDLNGSPDFWEYDPSNNTWTRKADFAGPNRVAAVGFSINGKGYIGLGIASGGLPGVFNDLWEYDPAGNTWTQRANMNGAARGNAVAFVVNNKAYVGTGIGNTGSMMQDFHEYNPSSNTWATVASIPGAARYLAAAFSVGTKGYVGTGMNSSFSPLEDFYEYNPGNNTWTAKANTGGGIRYGGVGFSIDTKGYIGLGFANSGLPNDTWEYDPAGNTWTKRADFSGSGRLNATATSINSKGYVGTGSFGSDLKDFHEYTPGPVLLDQTITFNSLASKLITDAAFNLTATSSSSLTVSYTSSNTGVATISGNTVTIVGAGSTIITASQGGNATYNPAPSIQQNLTVNKLTQSITFGALANKTFGDASFSLTATASSSLTVSYSSSNTSVATISGNTVTIAGGGTTTITASQAGNATYSAATSKDQNLTVNRLTQSITFGALSNKTAGDPSFALTATASSSLPVSYNSSNTSVATISGSTVTIVGGGTTTITASQSGDGGYSAAANVQQPFTVDKLDQTISFDVLSAKAFGSGNFNLSASATSSLPVSYTSSNTSVATVSGNTVTIVGAGNTTINATQSGNSSYNAAPAVPQALVINKANQALNTSAFPSSKKYGDPVFEFGITATSNLPITYSSSNTSVITVNGTKGTIVGIGTTTIHFSQAGNTNYNSIPEFTLDIAVGVGEQSITFPPFGVVALDAAPFAINASASSGLPISFISSDPTVASVSGSTITVKSLGSTTIYANQGGNAFYSSAGTVQRVLTITPITKKDQILTFQTLSARVIGDAPFTISPTVDSGLPLAISSSNPDVASIDGNTITIHAIGNTLITVSQAGNENYKAAKASQVLEVRNIIQTEDAQGLLWGVIKEGGANGYGSLFKTNSDGSDFTVVKDFDPHSDGYNPEGSLTLAPNEKFYGITRLGGTSNQGGVLFEFDPKTNAYSSKFNFNALSYPQSELILNENGMLYGITTQGQISSDNLKIEGGVIYQFNPATGVLTPKASISSQNYFLRGGLLAGVHGKLYCVGEKMGESEMHLLEYNIKTNEITSKGSLGQALYSAKLCFGPNGKIYGINNQGGANNYGFIFEYDTASNTYTKQYDFKGTDGGLPNGMIFASNGKLYGNTYYGGSFNKAGVIYEYDPSTHKITVKSEIDNDKGYVRGKLAEGPNKKLYMLSTSAATGASVIEYDLTTEATTLKLEFTASMGKTPYSFLTFYDGKFYGTTAEGGEQNAGVIFQYDYKSNTHSKKYDFKTNADGFTPLGTLTPAVNGKLYGMTMYGGASNEGTIFDYDPKQDTYTKRADLSESTTGNYLNSSNQNVSLLQGLNGKLYGTSYSQKLFEFNPADNSASIVYRFPSERPVGNLIQTNDGLLWGLKDNFNQIGLYQFDLNGNVPEQKATFSGQSTSTLYGALTDGQNGKIYGIVNTAGDNRTGYLFEYDLQTGIGSIRYQFPTDQSPGGGLTLVNGKLYGTTMGNGSNGQLYEFDPGSGGVTVKLSFVNEKGTYGQGSLLLAANGKLYGKTRFGGTSGNGVIFEYTPGSDTYIMKSSLISSSRIEYDFTSLIQTNDADKKSQAITFNALEDQIVSATPFTLEATASSSLPVQFSISSEKATIDSENKLKLIKAGRVTITASQPGNINFYKAPDVQQSFCINPFKPTISITNNNSDNVELQSSNAEGNQWFLNGEKIAGATSDKIKPAAAGTYSVQSSVDDCVSEIANFELVITGDLNTPLSVSLYPNPTQETLYVTLPGGSENKVDIVRTDGRSLEQLTTSQSLFEVNVKSYAPGLYLLRVSHSNGSVSVLKFIKQ